VVAHRKGEKLVLVLSTALHWRLGSKSSAWEIGISFESHWDAKVAWIWANGRILAVIVISIFTYGQVPLPRPSINKLINGRAGYSDIVYRCQTCQGITQHPDRGLTPITRWPAKKVPRSESLVSIPHNNIRIVLPGDIMYMDFVP
jgi:hypothetical protein